MRLLRKGRSKEVKLGFLGHALMENRHGLLMDFTVCPATTAEQEVVLGSPDPVQERDYNPRTLGADRGYDTKKCLRDIRARRSPADGRRLLLCYMRGHLPRYAQAAYHPERRDAGPDPMAMES